MIKSSIKLFYVSIIMFPEKWGDVNKKEGYFASSTPLYQYGGFTIFI